MKLTESRLKQIIKEELQKVLVTELTDDSLAEQAVSELPIAQTYTSKQMLRAISKALRNIMQASGARSARDLVRKYDKQHPFRQEFRQLYNIRKTARRKGGRIDSATMKDIVTSFGKGDKFLALAATLGLKTDLDSRTPTTTPKEKELAGRLLDPKKPMKQNPLNKALASLPKKGEKIAPSKSRKVKILPDREEPLKKAAGFGSGETILTR